jgi:hypothetical protein
MAELKAIFMRMLRHPEIAADGAGSKVAGPPEKGSRLA